MKTTQEAPSGSGSGASPQLYGGRSAAPWVVAAIFLFVAAGIAFILMWDGGGPIEDASDDLAHTRGDVGDSSEPLAATAADIIEASATEADGGFVFTSRMQAPVPDSYESAVLEITWRLRSSSGSWLVAAVIQDSVVASVTAEDGHYGASTADGTMPGSVNVHGSIVTVEFEPEAIDGFPESFEWFVSTRLAADRTAADPETVRDRAPDLGVATSRG